MRDASGDLDQSSDVELLLKVDVLKANVGELASAQREGEQEAPPVDLSH